MKRVKESNLDSVFNLSSNLNMQDLFQIAFIGQTEISPLKNTIDVMLVDGTVESIAVKSHVMQRPKKPKKSKPPKLPKKPKAVKPKKVKPEPQVFFEVN